MELKDVVKNRTSVISFMDNFVIAKEDIDAIIELNKLAPSAFNLQHANYHIILNKEVKEDFYNKVCKQNKILESSAVILVTGRLKPHLDFVSTLDDKMYSFLEKAYSEPNYALNDAYRNASLSAMQFMLLSKDAGFDTCPMSGFDVEAAKAFFKLESEQPVLVIAMGRENSNNKKIRQARKDIKDIVKYY